MASVQSDVLSKNMIPEHILLGIDLGTTSVKVCLLNTKGNQVLAECSKETQSNVPSDQGIGGNKQDVPKIVSALNNCIAKLPKDLLQRVERIGVCGQMHGIMFWHHRNGKKAWDCIEKEDIMVRYDIRTEQVSHLYTWQDNRCDAIFLANLPIPESHLRIYSGYGTATIFWMLNNKPEKLKKYDYSGTIQDFVVAMLCDNFEAKMSDQIAASWGYFNCIDNTWNTEILGEVNFPTNLLPVVEKTGSIAGSLMKTWHHIPEGTLIGVALGDLQCSVLSTLESCKDAVINISTSAQIAFIAEGFTPQRGPPTLNPIMYLPYFGGAYLAVAASLNGGNVLATFVKMVQQWCLEFGLLVPQAKVWDRLIELGCDDKSVSELQVVPTCLGERHSPDMTASIFNINIGNVEIGKVFRAICKGLIHNLHSMMPKDMLKYAQISRIVGNGSGLARNKVLQNEVQQIYELPLVFTKGGDAAKGSAMSMYLPSWE